MLGTSNTCIFTGTSLAVGEKKDFSKFEEVLGQYVDEA